ncbi:hypothetical protein C5C57_00930 [Rathayibacter sp. AY1C5]|nr:hypothetical protein C5C57_00930 [Rathayibacter sp. AY1C5]
MSLVDAVATARRPPAQPAHEKALNVGQDAEGWGTNPRTYVEERTAATIASQVPGVEGHRDAIEGRPSSCGTSAVAHVAHDLPEQREWAGS